MSINLGATATELQNLLINTASDNGTNWINYDLRSLEKQLGISDFSDTRISLFFGLGDTSPVTLISAGRMTGAQGLIQNNTAVPIISTKSGQAFLVINFDASANSAPQGTISTETDTQPIMLDLFSFGKKSNKDTNNAIYRFELKETSPNSSTFTGTVEYVIANQLNQFDPNLIKTLRPISDDVKFFVNQKLVDEKGINIAYSDLAQVGLTVGSSSKTDIRTNSGTVTVNSKTFRFGQPVTIVLIDPDLNINHDTIDIYSVIDNPASADVDTVGSASGVLLEVLIKDIRYKRCTINGITHGGLASTGFSLIETGPSTGIFEGTFKMPSQICSKDGTKLISSAGGIIDIKYHDFRDILGQRNIVSLSNTKQITSDDKKPSSTKITKYDLPSKGKTKDIPITGKVGGYKPGTKIKFVITDPNGKSTTNSAFATKQGNYKIILSLKHNSPTGKYTVDIVYKNSKIDQLAFEVNSRAIKK
jgi:hypothetical protein